MAGAVRSRTRERDIGPVFYDFLLLFTGARAVSPPRIRNACVDFTSSSTKYVCV
jgi:hypothetical protein